MSWIPLNLPYGPDNPAFLVQLREGERTIAERKPELSVNPATYEWELTQEEIDAVTDWSNVRVYFVAYGEQVLVSWAELEAPIGANFWTGDGGIVVGGAAAVAKTKDYIPIPTGVQLYGAAAKSRTLIGLVSGGVEVGGASSASFDHVYEYQTSGGIVASGAATTAPVYIHAYVPTGGVVVAGTASVSTTQPYSASGFVALSGAATSSYEHICVYQATGTVTLGGAAATTPNALHEYVATGGIVLGGQAQTTSGDTYEYSTSGTVQSGGSAVTSYSAVHTATVAGGCVLSGTFGVNRTWARSGAGNAACSGVAAHCRTKAAPSSGQAVCSGTAAVVLQFRPRAYVGMVSVDEQERWKTGESSIVSEKMGAATVTSRTAAITASRHGGTATILPRHTASVTVTRVGGSVCDNFRNHEFASSGSAVVGGNASTLKVAA